MLVDGVAKPFEIFVARRALHHDFTVDSPIAGTDGRVLVRGEKTAGVGGAGDVHRHRVERAPQMVRVEAVRDLVAGGACREHQLAQQLAKEVVRRIHGMPMDEALRLESTSFRNLAHSEDLAEGNAAFRERRQARFKSR